MHGESMTIDQKVYTPGDFVYYDIPENKRNLFNIFLSKFFFSHYPITSMFFFNYSSWCHLH